MTRDDYLIRKGDEGDKMYVIISGTLEVMNEDEETVKIELSYGDLVGEVALVYNEKRMASVRVKEVSRAPRHAIC
jgi:cAMP-dependent protein kinase regulator